MFSGLFIRIFTSKGRLKQVICNYLADLNYAPLGTILTLFLWKTQLLLEVAKMTRKNKAEQDIFPLHLEQLNKR